MRRSQDCALQDSILRCRRNSPGRARIEGEWSAVSAMLARSGATTATAPPELLAPVRRSPRVSTRPTLGTLKFCSTRWPDHARSRGTFRACHFSFGQASELSVPLDGEWPEQIVESRVAAFATQKIVSISQSVPAEVSKLCVGATCHGTTRLETCIPDEIRVCTLP